ncbi:MAG: dienelactone hydrolase, partial [Chloroflexota bacterium]
MKKYLLIVIAFVLSGVLTVAQDDTFIFGDPLPTAPELAQRGEYSVGVRTIEVTNPEQFDLLNLSEENPTTTYDRVLTLEVWYPATLADGQEELVTYDENLGRADADNLRPFTFQGRA